MPRSAPIVDPATGPWPGRQPGIPPIRSRRSAALSPWSAWPGSARRPPRAGRAAAASGRVRASIIGGWWTRGRFSGRSWPWATRASGNSPRWSRPGWPGCCSARRPRRCPGTRRGRRPARRVARRLAGHLRVIGDARCTRCGGRIRLGGLRTEPLRTPQDGGAAGRAAPATRRSGLVTLLETISGPRDLKKLSPDELPRLASEIRDVLIETVTRTSGHLGPNLGVVELTIALHRVFDSPVDRVVFDVGPQAYVHKLLTGRHQEFGTLRLRGGVSGYPSRAESEHDLVENSHASTSLCYADGLAKAYRLRGETDRTVVAVIGDGALTGGMAWEALNNIAVAKDSRLIVVVNDNGRSYQPTIGGLADHLAAVRVSQRYEQVLDYIKTTLSHTPLVGPPLYETLHGIKKGIKDVLQPQVLFEDLGIKYLGPVDGHDEQLVEQLLRRARDFGGPVIVHVITRKGFGYPLAEQNEEDCLHQVPPAPSPAQAGVPPKRTWSEVFGDELLAIGKQRSDVVAITAAMLHPTGLAPFARAYPDRVFDVGIAEQHAMTSAAGLAMGGLHPV